MRQRVGRFTIDLPEEQIEEYFATARVRYNIMLRRNEGMLPPWTVDVAFSKYRFCNVFREDDRVTRFIKNSIREPMRESPHVLTAMVASRFFNREETLLRLVKAGFFPRWNSQEACEVLKDVRPVTGAAYMIKTPTGLDKLHGVCAVVDMSVKPGLEIMTRITPGQTTLQEVWEKVRMLPFLGDFLAYEIVTDLRHTAWLDQAPDIFTWAVPGPGAVKGLAWLAHKDFEAIRYGTQQTRDAALDAMRRLRIFSRVNALWPREWPRWEMREVEHWLCEYAKWVRVRYLGQRMKRLFRV